jgi:hypothetical protein
VPEDQILAHLFAAVKQESLLPTVLSIWLSTSRSPVTLLHALEQEFSVLVCSSAIKHFPKLLRRKRWMETWNGVCGTPGLLSLFNQFSVWEVKRFLTRIPAVSMTRALKKGERESLSSFMAFFPSSTQTTLKSSDERPPVDLYSSLVPTCSSKFVDELLRNAPSPLLSNQRYQKTTNSYLLRE